MGCSDPPGDDGAAGAIEFYKKAFNAVKEARLARRGAAGDAADGGRETELNDSARV